MKVENEIQIYERDGKELGVGMSESMKIKSHGIRRNFVVLEIDGKRITVVDSDLEKAIANATNWK